MYNSGPSGLSFNNMDDLEDKSAVSETKISPKTQLDKPHDLSKRSLQLQPSPFKNNDGVYNMKTAPSAAESPILNKTQLMSQDHYSSRRPSDENVNNMFANKPTDASAGPGAVTSLRSTVEHQTGSLVDTQPHTSSRSGNCNGDEQLFDRKSFADTVKKPGVWYTAGKSQKPKANGRFLGRKGCANISDGKFRAAEPKVKMFITKVHQETTEQNIVDHIYDETQERIVLQKLSIKGASDHCAYTFLVSKNKLDLFLNESLWPKGVIFREFVHYKHKYMKSLSTSGPNGNNKLING
jgi:hypothetical protein